VEFGILGPVAAWAGDRRVALGSAKIQCILAVLLRVPGTPVSREALVDRVWGDRVPGTSVRYKYVGQLRAALEPHGVELISRDGGYLLAARAEQVDLHRFRNAVAQGRAALAEGSLGAACRFIADGLAQWRGSAVAGPTGPWAELFRTQLERERRDARVLLARCLMDLDRAEEALGLLVDWQVDYPVDEDVIGLHVLALYRCGRRADALFTYQHAVDRLGRSLGLGPGERLAQLGHRIRHSGGRPDRDHPAETRRPRPAARFPH
jgi:DNA-binding SARP family transcriptional activator